MVEMLEEVDTEGVPFTSNVVETVNVMRQDRAQAGWNRDELLKMCRKQKTALSKYPQSSIMGGWRIMTELHNRSLEELHHMLVSKEITVQDLTKQHLNESKKQSLRSKHSLH